MSSLLKIQSKKERESFGMINLIDRPLGSRRDSMLQGSTIYIIAAYVSSASQLSYWRRVLPRTSAINMP